MRGHRSPEKNKRTKARNEERKASRFAEAQGRQHERDKLTPAQQLERLEWRVGKEGAKKERARLLEQIAKAAKPKEKPKKEEEDGHRKGSKKGAGGNS